MPLFWKIFAAAIVLPLSSFLSEELVQRFPGSASFRVTSGILAGLLLLSPRRHWPYYVAAYALPTAVTNLFLDYTLHSALLRPVINSLEALLVAACLSWDEEWISGRTDRLASWARFVLVGMILVPGLGALAGGILTAQDRGAPYLNAVQSWWIGHAFAMCLMVPILLRLRMDQVWELRRNRRAQEALLLLAIFTIAAVGVFSQASFLPLFVLTPILIVILFRIGFVGLTAGMAILAILSVAVYYTETGPFMALATAGWRAPAQLSQLFLMLLFVTLALIAALLDERQKLQIQIEVLVGVDALTGLPNRRKFDESLRIEWQRGRRDQATLTLVLIDVDHFKQYNDTYGHAAGDECLTLIAKTIADSLSRPGDLCARFGGEEFAVVLPNTGADGAHEIATRFCQAIRDAQLPHAASPHAIVTVSVGAATVTPDPQRQDSLLFGAADAALYRAKAEGRNRVSTVDLDRRSGTRIVPAVS